MTQVPEARYRPLYSDVYTTPVAFHLTFLTTLLPLTLLGYSLVVVAPADGDDVVVVFLIFMPPYASTVTSLYTLFAHTWVYHKLRARETDKGQWAKPRCS